MTRTQRIVVLALVGLLAVLTIAPASAGGGSVVASEDSTETTVAPTPVPISEGEQPAVVIPPPEADDAEQPWTARFLIPLLVVTAVLLIIGVVIAYNSSIRRRYKVVAE